MQYRIDKKTGGELSILSFGCMRFPNRLGIIDMQKTEEIIMHAIKNGVNYFDTAWIYPGSEDALGSVLRKNNVREKVKIATKLPVIMFKSSSSSINFDKYFNQSLERLKTDYIDYYLMHMLTDMDQWKRLKDWGIEDWITQKKKSGAVKQVGFSFHGSGNEFLQIIDDYDWELAMIQYNYFDENFQAGVKGLHAAAKKMPVIAMEPLLGGKLAIGLPKDAVKILEEAQSPTGGNSSPAAWALNWLWNQGEVTSVLSGMNTIEQLKENIKSAEAASAGMLNDTFKTVYTSVLESIKRTNKVLCTGCNYCMPCPVGINISGSFAAYNARYSMGYFEGMKQYIMSTGFTQVKSASPSLCTKCGICENNCPQKIPIINELITVKRRMEPWFIRFVGVCARAFLGKSRKNK
ncbi:MAG: aldo/keto reductase [Treponema sp.]|jgi:predicted aldo/keto reductase-like oxidoreductase|nr:aldo/keto reductase [Treponema sp.]